MIKQNYLVLNVETPNMSETWIWICWAGCT